MKRKYKCIMFDMDGTLLPMDMKEFTGGYFKFLCERLRPYGFDDKKLVEAVWKGTAAMQANDGSQLNSKVFWDCFDKLMGGPIEEIAAECDDFYSKEFNKAICFTQENPLAQEAVRIAHAKSPLVILATNPLFPVPGQISRMNWVGLSPEDFDLYTSYETEYFCKPNPKYFESVMERMGLKPEECLMVGNDEYEDMYCATMAGIDGYLVTDTMIPSVDHPWEGSKGTFAELVEALSDLEEY